MVCIPHLFGDKVELEVANKPEQKKTGHFVFIYVSFGIELLQNGFYRSSWVTNQGSDVDGEHELGEQ